MKIISIQALRGPNYWSRQNENLIQLRMDTENADENFYVKNEHLKALFQFLNLGEVSPIRNFSVLISAIIPAILKKADIPVHYFHHFETIEPGIHVCLFNYANEKSGTLIAKTVIKWLNLALHNQTVNYADDVAEITRLVQESFPSPEILDTLTALKEKHIPYLIVDDKTVQVGYGINQQLLPVSNLSEYCKKSTTHTGNIPIIAITGSNGKTTTTRLIAHIIGLSGKVVGFTTSDGIYVDQEMVDHGDTTGPVSAQAVLADKRVEVAVLETARGGILRAGLGFNTCDISVITNIQDDHLGISDIHTLEDLANVKKVVLNATAPNGYSVLNADNPFTLKMAVESPGKAALFSMHQSAAIIQHCKNGGIAAYVEQNQVVICECNQEIIIEKLAHIPITFNGTVSFMIQNVLAASLAAYLFHVEIPVITQGLKSFFPSAEQTPGRMNIFDVGIHKVMIDFAHNADGFRGIRDFLKCVDSPRKVGIIVGTGDRKEEDVIELGRLSSEMFDHIIIHQKKFLRGRPADELVRQLITGIHMHDPNKTVEHIPDETEPLGYALQQANTPSFIVALSDVLDNPIDLVKQYKAEAK